MREAWAHRFARVTRVIPQLQPPKFDLALSWNGGMVWTATHGNSPKIPRDEGKQHSSCSDEPRKKREMQAPLAPARHYGTESLERFPHGNDSRADKASIGSLSCSPRGGRADIIIFHRQESGSHSPAAPLTQPRRPQNSRKLLEVHVSSEQGRVVTQKNENN